MLSKNICFVSAGIFQSIRKNSKRNALVLIVFMMIFSGLFNSKSLSAQNANPTFLTVPITSVDRLGSYQYVILTNDADGDVVTVTGTTIPSWMNLSAHESAVSTFAGSGTTGSANGSGSAAEFSNLQALAIDANGNIYVAESGSHSIRKITKDGNVTTFAGNGTAGYTDGTGTQAQFDFPQGVAIDANGNVFIGDKKNHRIRKITPEGVVTTFAGSGAVGFDSGTGTLATFNSPQGLSFGPNGNLYVADQLNHSIRKITPAGFVDVLAGTGTSGFQDGNVAEFNAPSDVVIDENGVVYVADKLNRRIRKIASGITTTLAGNGSTGFANGAGSNARFGSPFSLAISNTGNIYVADETNHRIRSVSPSGEVITVAGGETSGALNGVALNATFKNPRGITSDDKGNFYIADRTNAQIRKLVGTSYVLSGDPSASLGTHAVSLKATDTNGGESTQAFNVEISLGSVSFTSSPVTVVNSNEEYVYQIQTSGTTGEARNVAGTTLPSWMHFTSSLGSNVKTLAGVTSSSGNTDGPGTSAKFDNPTGMVVDDLGNVFVVDRSNHRIRKIALDGSVSTFAGSSSGYVNGTGTNAKFNNPRGIVIDKSGNLYVTDTNNGRIRKITPEGVVTDFAGSGAFGTNDGMGTLAKFATAYAIAIDKSDNLYVTEQYRIRKITPDAVVSTLAGGSISPGLMDGTGSDARFGLMTGIAVADDGNIYVAGQQNNVIRKITQAGVVTTLAGSGTSGFSNGTGTSTMFNSPSGIAIADNGNLYVTDNDNYRVRKVTTAGVVTSFLGSGTQGAADGNGILAEFAGPYGITIDNNGNLYVNDQNTSVVKKVDGTSLKLIGIPAGQTGNHNVVLTLTDGLGVTATQNFVVTIIDATDPVITSPSAANYVENGSGTAYTIAATDQNPVTYSLGTGNDEGLFNVTLDKVTFKTPPDFESPTDLGQDNTYIVQVRASDGTNTATKTVTITVTDIDDTAPVFTSPNSVNFKEKTAGIAYAISATDVNAITYSLGTGNDESLFNISNGNVSFKTLPDFANPIDQGNDNTYEINVIASDGVNSGSKLVTITVTDGTAPIFTSQGTTTFAENSVGSVFQATATDASPVTYSIEPGNDGTKFNINSGILSFKTVPDFEQPHDTDGNNSYLVNLKASDGVNNTLFTLSINVTNVDDTPPVITSSAAVSFVENGTGTVYTIQATDANAITYSLLQVNDYALFNIVDNVITFKITPDFEAPDGSTANNQYHIRVRAADANNVADRDVIITVTDLDEIAPVFTSSTGVSFAENATGTAYTSLATDAAAVTYSLGTGNDESLFNISGDAFTFKTPPDFENPNDGGNNNTYLVQVRATDVAGNTANQVVTITVTDVVEFPVFTSTPSTTHDNDQNYRYDIQVNGFEHINVTGTNIPSWLSLKKTATVSTLAGNGTAGNPSSTNTRFSSPKGIVVDNATGRIFTIDQDGSFIQRIDLNGENGLHVNECSFDITCSKTNPFGFNGLQDITFGDDGNPIFIEKNSFYQITRNGNIYYEGGSGVGFADGIGGNAQFTSMQGITFDPVTKNIYVSDANRIRKIQLTSTVGQAIVSTVAGSSASGAADGQGIAASFNGLKGLTTDPSGNIFVADTANHLIRKITPTGLVSTFAGSGSNADIDGQGTFASFSYPKDIEIDHYGNLYVVTGSNKVRMITPSGQVTTIAGTGVSGFNNGDESVATFSNIQGIAIDKEGILYISDKNNHGIRKIVRSYYLEGHPNGLVGNYGVGLRATDTQNRATDQNFTIIVGDATVPNITSPISATFHHQGTGNAYTVVATDDNSISYSLGTGNDEALFNISGSALTFKTPPDFNNPTDSDRNNTYVVEVKASDGTNTAKQNVTISILDGPPVFTSTPVTSVDNTGAYNYDITTTGFDTEISATSKPSWLSLIKNTAVQTLLGTGSQGNSNASGTAAQFASPRAIAVDNGNFYLYSIDRFGTRVRRSNLSGGAVTFVTNLSFVDPNLVVGQEDSFSFQKLEDIAVDGDGNVYMVDSEVHGVYKLANDGHILSLSGWVQGTADGNGILVPPGRTGPDAQYNAPTGIVYDYVSSSLYVSDGNRIRKVDPSTGDAITIAGSGSAGSANGLGTAATFNGLKGLATDASGNIYAADTANHLIRKITPAGLVTTFAGSGSSIDTDGIGTLASFNSPKDIVIDPGGNLYVVTGGNKVRKVTPAGIVTTIVGTGVAGFDNGNGAASTFNGITSIAMGPALNFYLVDKKNHAIRKITKSGYSLEGTPIDVAGDFNVELTATDNLSRNTIQNFTITVNDAVDPVFTSATAVNFAENATNAAYTSVVTDASPVTFSLGTGNDEALFNIANGEVTFKSAPDFENSLDGDNNNSYIIKIIALDAANNAKTQQVTITVTDVEEDVSVPVFTSTTTASFVENATGTVYVINATDNNPITYALGTGNDEIFFDLNGPTITFKSIPDFEVKSSYTIEVQANDGINLSKQTVLVSITDVDEVAPVFTSPIAVSFAENGIGTAYTVTATDVNPITYSLGTAHDGNLFNISEGVVTFKTVPNFEDPHDGDNKNNYVIKVKANDGTNTVSQTVTISVTDVLETAPKVLSVVRKTPANEVTNSSNLIFRVTFNEAVKNVDATDFGASTTGDVSWFFTTVFAISETVYDVKFDNISGNGDFNFNFSFNQNIENLASTPFTGMVDSEEGYTVDNVAPIIKSAILNTVAKTFVEGDHIDITVVYDENVVVNTSTGIPFIKLPFASGDKNANYLSGSGSTSIVFRYTVEEGVSGFPGSGNIKNIKLTNGGTIQDLVPQNADLLHPIFSAFGNKVDAKRPSITSSAITAKTYALGNALDITVKYDEEVVVNTTNGVPSMTINIGGENRTAAYFSGSGTSSIKFRYITQEGDSDSDGVTISDIQLNGGVMEDSFGNFANLSVNTSGVEGVRVDTKAPAVISSSVVAKTYGQGDFLDVTVVYDEVVLVNTTLNTPYIPINIGSSSQRANYINGSGTNSIVFRYEMSFLNDNDGIEVLDIVPLAGKLTDEAGNNASLSSNNASEQGGVRVDTTKPVITSKENASLLENTSAFAYVITATDLNSITYSLGATNDENLFNLDGNTLTFKTAPDFETPKDTNGDNVYLVEVIASDAVNAAALLVKLTVTDIDEIKPVFTSGTTGTLMEGELGVNVYSSQATDANPVSFSLGSANDEQFFNMSNGVVKSNFISDFENPSDADRNNKYVIEIIASDGLNTTSQLVTIAVTDVDENAPVFTSPLVASFAENDNGVAYTAVATDESPITYSLGTGNDSPFFSISGSDITFKTPPNFEAPIDAGKNNTYVIEVIVSDGNRTASRFVTITVTNVDENAPVFTSVTAVNYAENGTGTAYSIIATDENAITYSLGTGNDESAFTLSADVLTFKSSPDFEAKSSYVVNVIATDETGNASNQDVTITILDVDENAPVFTSVTAVNYAENGTGTAYSITATDENAITYSLGTGNDESAFTLSTGVLTFKSSPDFETKSSYVVNMIATDETGNASNQDVTITILNVDDTAPVFTSLTAVSFAENGIGIVYKATSTDESNVSYSLGMGNDELLFNMSVEGDLTFSSAPDFELPTDRDENNDYLILVKANDGIQESTQLVTILVTDLNEVVPDIIAPVFTSGTAVNYRENETVSAYTVIATDTNPISYSLGTGNDESLFNLIGGSISFKVSPDFENPVDANKNNSYVLAVRAFDGSNTSVQTVIINIVNVDEVAPVITSATAVNYAENGTGTAYTITATDENAITYSLGTGNDESAFTLSAGVLTFKSSPDFETKSSYVVNMIATDETGNASNQDVMITILDVDENAPVFTSVTAVSYTENGAGTVYIITATDENAITYSLGTGNDESAFTLSAGVLTFKSSPDFEAKSSYVVNMIATDDIGNTSNQDVTITILDVDENVPVITSATAVSYTENGAGTAYSITATDENAITYSLGTGNDESAFTLSTGVLTFKSSPDFETKSSYVVNVIATDETGNASNQEVTITILDVDENAPVITSATAVNYAENGAGTAYTITATDENAITYSLGTGNDESAFTLSAGVLTFKSSPDFETKSSYVVNVIATDETGNTSNQDVTITILDVDENAPVITSATAVNYAENGAGTAYTITATDDNAITYSLGTGNDESAFTLSAGVLTFKSSPDFEIKSSYVVNVIATDETGNTSNQDVTITILDVDEESPSVVVTSGSNEFLFDQSFKVTVTFNEDVESFKASDLLINNGNITSFTGSEKVYMALVTAIADGEVQVSVPENVTQDASGNKNNTSNILIRKIEAINVAPSAIDLSGNTIAENNRSPILVGLLSAIDIDERDVHSFTLVTGEGSTHNHLFNIVDNSLIAKTVFDYELLQEASIRIRATDARGLALDVIKVIEVLNVEEPQIAVFVPNNVDPTKNDVDLSFEALRIGKTISRELEISNTGNDGDLSISGISLPSGYSIDKSTITIASGAKEVFTVSFSPIEEKVYSGEIVISSNAGEKKVLVGGKGLNNRAPIAVSTEREILITLADLINLRGYDPDGDAIEFIVTQQPENGTLAITNDGFYSFIPNTLSPGQVYQDVLKFKVVETEGGLESNEAIINFKFRAIDSSHSINALDVNSKTDEVIEFGVDFIDPILNDAYQLKVSYYNLSDPSNPEFVPLIDKSVLKSEISSTDGVHSFTFNASSTNNSYLFNRSRVFVNIELTTANGYSASGGFVLKNEGTGSDNAIIEGSGSSDGEFFVFASKSTAPENEAIEVNMFAIELGGFSIAGSTIAITKSPLNGVSTSPVEVNKTDNLAQWKLTYTSETEVGLLDSLQFTVYNPERDLNANAFAKVEVIEVADAPQLGAISDQQTNEEESLMLELEASDADSEISITATSSNPNDITLSLVDNSLLITPGLDFTGTTSISVLVTESNETDALSTFDEFQLTVNPINDKPVMTPIEDLSVNEDGQVVVSLSASDVDAELPLFSYDASSEDLDDVNFTIEGNALTITPKSNFNGVLTFNVTANDGEGTENSISDSEFFNVTVNAVNDAPTSSATISTQTLLEAIPSYELDLSQYFTDVETEAKDLIYDVSDIANAELSINGSILTVLTLNGVTGVETADISASDGELSVTQQVTFVATATNAEVTVENPIADQELIEDFGFSSIDLTGVFALSGNPGASFTYVISGNNAVNASVNGSLLELTSTQDFNGVEELIVIGTSDGKSSFTSFKITVSPSNDAPSLINGLEDVSTAEDVLFIYEVSSTVFDDVDGDDLTYSATYDASWLSFDASTRKFSGTPNNDNVGDFTVVLTVTDPAGQEADDSFQVVVSNTNDNPTAIITTNSRLDENIALNSVVTSLTSVDPDVGDDIFSYALVSGSGDTDNDQFTFVGNELLSNSIVDFETKASYSIRIKTTDGFEGSLTQVVNLTVNDVNEIATDIIMPVTIVTENQGVGTAVSELTTTDPDASDSHSYSLVSGEGDADNADFTITDGRLTTVSSFDFETKSSYSVRIKTTDSGGLALEKAFRITVSDVNEVATDLALSANSIAENASISSDIADLTTTDQDANDSHSYSLVTGEGDTDNAFFKIEGTKLLAAASFDHETKSTYVIRLKTADTDGLAYEKSFTITVTDVNEAPTNISSDNLSIAENQEVGTSVGTLSTTDQDEADAHSYSLVAGEGDADNASFTIDGGVLKSAISFNFEVKDNYVIRIRTIDAEGLAFEKSLTVSIADEPEAEMRIVNNGNLDPVEVGSTATFNLTVFNDGDGAMNVSSIVYPEGFSGVTNISEIAPATSVVLEVSFTPLEAKTYSGDLILTYNGGQLGIGVSAIGQVITSIDDTRIAEAAIKMYPNPAADQFTLNLAAFNGRPINITIVNGSGLKIYSAGDIRKLEHTIQVSNYSQGIFIVMLQSGNQIIKKKLIIRR